MRIRWSRAPAATDSVHRHTEVPKASRAVDRPDTVAPDAQLRPAEIAIDANTVALLYEIPVRFGFL
jgi:hypothetical protein